ncbi:proline-rich protein 14-like, partial [Heterodontus francisci]|uniref:proline-rich protein 14-like n=1 Tax=Heterodontus francisci TaxID=7792 RepID=UPI00355C3F90
LNKKEFSLEEIYTNKNYKAPTEKRSFETIFEEAGEEERAAGTDQSAETEAAVEFQDSSLPRKRKLRQRLRQAQRGPVWSRVLRSAMREPELELLLRQRLEELDALSAVEDNSDA